MKKYIERNVDLEENYPAGKHLVNDLVDNFSWTELAVNVKARSSKELLEISSNSHGVVSAGLILVCVRHDNLCSRL